MEKELARSIYIEATPQAVWDTLTQPDKIRQYMFGASTDTDWQPGSPIDYYISKDGQNIKVVTGTILEVKAPYYLSHTLFPVGWPIDDIPENYLHCIYQIAGEDNGTELTVLQRDFESIALGERRYNDAMKGWDVVLPKIKEVAEGKA